MNFPNEFKFSNLLLAYKIAFIFKVSLLSILFKDALLLNNYELGLIPKRNLAEMLQGLQHDEKNENTKILSKEEVIEKFVSAEYLSSKEIVDEYKDVNFIIHKDSNCMERDLAIIFGRFCFEGITLPINQLLNVYKRIIKRANLRNWFTLYEKRSIFEYILSIEKSVSEESLKSIICEEKKVEQEDIMPILREKSFLLEEKLKSLDIRLPYEQNNDLKYIIDELIKDVIVYFNKRFSEDAKIDERYVNELFDTEYLILISLIHSVYTGVYVNKPIYDNCTFILKMILKYFSASTIELTYVQFKNIYHRLLERVFPLDHSELTTQEMHKLFNAYEIENNLTINHVIREINKPDEQETQHDMRDVVKTIENKVNEALQSEDILMSQEEVRKMALRIYRSTTETS
ncbi:hypothetical protein PRELSG_0022800 [Plasmodium relictum]|uniref:Uncharacterized protein n=1 Tax=Plasmodium relictum TaxID=85471 RepID=A0A1J1GK38_PLARL|nr:hypothetical protein PRELSG_0022800 [Plasmodium relictum]CRG84543.1 hypothetical protein PRELSG_0022800 [Plasmodium relictum]